MNSENQQKEPMMAYYVMQAEDANEVNLLGLWQALVRQWKVIFSVTFIFLLASIMYVFAIATPIYESRFVIQVGQVGQVGQVEDVNSLVARIKFQYHLGDKGRDWPRVSFLAPIDTKSFVEVRTQAHSGESAKGLADKVADDLLQLHQQYFEQKLAIEEDRRHSMQALLGSLKEQRAQLQSGMANILEKNSALAVFALLDRSKLDTQIESLTERLASMDLSMLPINTFVTKLQRQAVAPKESVEPKRMRIVVLMLFGGLGFGFFTAFIVEVLRKARSGSSVSAEPSSQNSVV